MSLSNQFDPVLGAQKLKTKSIPNVEDDRLFARREHLHNLYHTPEGLRSYDNTKRGLVDQGMIIKSIADEIESRGLEDPNTCRFCTPRSANG